MIFPRLRYVTGASLIVFGMLLSPAQAQLLESNLQIFNYSYSYNIGGNPVTRTIPVKIYVNLGNPGDPGFGQPLPVVMYLHGAGERGNSWDVDGNSQADSWAFSDSLKLIDRPAVYVAPRGIKDFATNDPEYLANQALWGSTAPSGSNFGYDSLGEYWLNNYGSSDEYNHNNFPLSASLRGAFSLTDTLITSPQLTLIDNSTLSLPLIDANRQYIVGWSAGGDGAWDAVVRAPRKYAAAIPVSGVGDPGAFFGSNAVAGIESQAVRAFAGSSEGMDQQVSIAKMQTAMSNRGAIGTAQILTGENHFSISNTVFGNQANRDWLFAQSSAVVPEPATLTLCGVGLLILRRRSKA
jgi:pimeloyl-ACP methyl ester carboxylesterase